MNKYIIATTEYFQSVGQSTTEWRKSLDLTKAICHIEIAEITMNNLEDNENITILTQDQAIELMATPEWQPINEELI